MTAQWVCVLIVAAFEAFCVGFITGEYRAEYRAEPQTPSPP